MEDEPGASGDAPEQPEGIFQLIDKLEKILDQIVQEWVYFFQLIDKLESIVDKKVQE